MSDCSGIGSDGRVLAGAGWSLFTLGMLVASVAAAIPVAIAVVVLMYARSLEGL